MSMRNSGRLAAGLLIMLAASLAWAGEAPKLGQRIDELDVAVWNNSIMPDGRGLPAGSGDSVQGAAVFALQCAACHGEGGKGGAAASLLPKGKITSINGSEKSIGNFWPYATTLFDYIRRAMPWQAPKSLSSDEVYALTAYLLELNKVVPENAVMDARSLPLVRMPNRDGFVIRFPELM